MEQPPAYQPSTSEHASQPKASAALYVAPEDNYGEGPVTVSDTPVPFPAVEDSPVEVRAYIYDFLARNATAHGLAKSDISRLTESWRHGTGRELRDYDLSTWKELMGTEMGTIMYNQVQKVKPTPPMPTIVKVILLLPGLFFTFFIGAITLSIMDADLDSLLNWLPFVFIFVSLVVGVFCSTSIKARTATGWQRMRDIRARRSRRSYAQIPLDPSSHV